MLGLVRMTKPKKSSLHCLEQYLKKNRDGNNNLQLIFFTERQMYRQIFFIPVLVQSSHCGH